MPEKYAQGMVRPGVWAQAGWAQGYVDQQWRIAKTLEALHTNLATYWDTHSRDNPEDRARLSQMYVNTSADFAATWLTSGRASGVSTEMAQEILSRPAPSPCLLCDAPNPHCHDKPWRGG